MSGGSSRYAPSDPLSADLTPLASVTSPASTSAPRERSSATFSGWRTSTRIFLPASSNLLATTEPVFPLAPKTVNMDSSRSWTRTAQDHTAGASPSHVELVLLPLGDMAWVESPESLKNRAPAVSADLL